MSSYDSGQCVKTQFVQYRLLCVVIMASYFEQEIKRLNMTVPKF